MWIAISDLKLDSTFQAIADQYSSEGSDSHQWSLSNQLVSKV